MIKSFLFSASKGCTGPFYHNSRLSIQAGLSQIFSRPAAGRSEPPGLASTCRSCTARTLMHGAGCWGTPALPHISLSHSLSWDWQVGARFAEPWREDVPARGGLLCCEIEESTEPSSACWHPGWFEPDARGNVSQRLLTFYPACSQ